MPTYRTQGKRSLNFLSAWKYKQDPAVQMEMWEIIRHVAYPQSQIIPENDDRFDALVAFILGARWLSGDGSVELVGSKSSGAMLLPAIPGLSQALDEFVGTNWKG